jgi:CDP-6-deoxy-D-xylo-4-hexulose-3-dehydrase
MNRRELIEEFLEKVKKQEGNIPKFCHNLNAPPNKVYYSGAYFDNNELIAAIDALLFGKWSSSGEICAKFEKEFSKHINQKSSFFTNSGSSANLLLIAACKEYFKWNDGDEIIVSAVGFPTTVSSIVQNGLKPVFTDIEWNTLNFDLDKVESAYCSEIIKSSPGHHVRAIFLSPVLGNPPDMNRLVEFCRHNEIVLLLDNCDSLGSKWRGKYLNEYVTASSCSFYPAHEITTLEGGMVSSNVEEIVQLARSYATWGRDCWCVGTANLLANGSCTKRFSNWLTDFPDTIIDHKYVFNRIGYNLKPLDLQGAIGLEQLKKLDYICETRAKNQALIQSLFDTYIKKLRFPLVLTETWWVPFGVPIICDSKEQKNKLVAYLEKNGIQTRNYFAGNLLMHNGYKHLGDFKDFPESNKVLDLVFFVGCSPTISPDNINYIKEVLSKYEN